MIIRDAAEADLPAIIEIYNAATATRSSTARFDPVTVEERLPWFRAHSPDEFPLWVTEIDGEIAGWLSFHEFIRRPAYRHSSFVIRHCPKGLLLVPDDQMDHARGIGNPEPVEIFPELFDFIPPRDAVNLQIGRGGFGVVRFQLEPDIGMAQVRNAIHPEPVRAELKNAAFGFLLDQRQTEGVAIKPDGLLVGVARAFDRDIRAAGKLRAVDVGNHRTL
jgi:hypothetical protein